MSRNSLDDTGIDLQALDRYIGQQIYTLPGTERHEQVFTILLTGSRAVGVYTPKSDVDVNVLCPPSVYESVHAAALEAGIVKARQSFFVSLPGDDWARYYGRRMGRPHFSVTSLADVARQFRGFEDVPLWIWTNARVIADPSDQFQQICDAFDGYPPDVLVRKIKYRWLLAGFWQVVVYPFKHHRPEDRLAAYTSLVNSINELLRVFFLVDRRPFPYAKKLMHLAPTTSLGKRFVPFFQRILDLVVGENTGDANVWQRLDKAIEMLISDQSAECVELEEACSQAMIDAGVDPQWVDVDFGNIDELLTGKLGPLSVDASM